MRRLAVCGALLVSTSVCAQQARPAAPAPGAAAHTLERVEVGVKSPPMWRMTKGDRTIVVLGTQYPLPETMPFYPKAIERELSQSQVALWPPGVRANDGVSVFRGMMLWNSLRNAKQNPDGQTLKQVLPPDTYAKWQAAKVRYLRGNDKVESLRPMYAAYELYEAALKSVGVRKDDPVWDVIQTTTKASKIPLVDTRFSIPVKASKSTARAFDVPAKDDLACLESTLDRLDGFVAAMSDAANAWSIGNMPEYRAAIMRYTPLQTCWARMTNEALADMSGISDPYGRTEATWLATLRSTLASRQRVFAMLPARDMVNHTGVVRTLLADGWTLTPIFKEAP